MGYRFFSVIGENIFFHQITILKCTNHLYLNIAFTISHLPSIRTYLYGVLPFLFMLSWPLVSVKYPNPQARFSFTHGYWVPSVFTSHSICRSSPDKVSCSTAPVEGLIVTFTGKSAAPMNPATPHVQRKIFIRR